MEWKGKETNVTGRKQLVVDKERKGVKARRSGEEEEGKRDKDTASKAK